MTLHNLTQPVPFFFFFFTPRALKIKNASAMHGLILKAKSDIQKKCGFKLVFRFTVKLKRKLPTQSHQSLSTSCFLLSLFQIFLQGYGVQVLVFKSNQVKETYSWPLGKTGERVLREE